MGGGCSRCGECCASPVDGLCGACRRIDPPKVEAPKDNRKPCRRCGEHLVLYPVRVCGECRQREADAKEKAKAQRKAQRRDRAPEDAIRRARATIHCTLDDPCVKHRQLAEAVMAA